MSNLLKIATNHFMDLFNKSWKYSKKSYSQEGEDLVLDSILHEKKNGFYIDIGAHHPFRFSNTYFFYKKGWRGINIDATPGSMNLFKKHRPRDINLEIPISNDNKKINYFIFNEPALNSFSKKLSKERNINTTYKIEKVIKLAPKRLAEVLDKYLPQNINIDFMSIDVEGYEYQVLTSSNWNKYQPNYILIELLRVDFDRVIRNKIYKFLKNKNYKFIAFTGRTAIFKLDFDKRA